jgi:hypothetical protein
MVHVGTVTSEGGPFLLADAREVRRWQGNCSNHYQLLGDALSAAGPTLGLRWSLGEYEATIWQPEGPGTAEVFSVSDDSLLLVLGLFFDGDWAHGIRTAAAAPAGQTDEVGEIDLPSGVLAILWSPESGRCVLDADISGGNTRPTGGLTFDESGLLTRLPRGRYRCLADIVAITQGEAVRCLVKPIARIA